MTLPVSAAFSSGSSTTGTVSVTMPAGVSAGDLLLVVTSSRADPSTIAIDRTISGNGWWTVGAFLNTFLNNPALNVYAKIATGSDALTLIDINNSLPALAYIAVRITGHGSAVTISSKVQSNNAQCDPPSLTQSGAAQDTLWIAVAAFNTSVPTAAPSGYSDFHTANVASGVAVAYADNGVAASSTQDPGTFTVSNDWALAVTIAVASTAITTKARATQASVETISQVSPKSRLTQASVETISQVNPNARVTQVAVEVLSSTATATASARPVCQVCG